ncbi:flagellar hook-length control protein FliK [Paraburkholderia sp.]|uniref:flagellar hook-length control protein FliK n=1 Tax=Paraburkholderia sp. TaxID=1926495 RepID=UPI002396EBDC|nr:flagellar hook-length control protein FliK [Paraburkholderia sp.]MDE1181208.1 flagellar hook-length control protein FliK [Paraburkholderia sp.]
MNGIDTALASLLANRVDSLLNITPGRATTSQAGASTLGLEQPLVTPPPAVAAAPQASAQTALSAVALTLNAIASSGGGATPAVVGQLPIWPAAPGIDVEVGALPLFDPLGSDPATSSSTATTGTASVGATHVPVAQLAAALERTVADSGLFYESHLAQWLSGQRSPVDLASEPQNRLLANATQLPLDWSGDGDPASAAMHGASPVMASATGAGGNAAQSGPLNGSNFVKMALNVQSFDGLRAVLAEGLAHAAPDLPNVHVRALSHAPGSAFDDGSAAGNANASQSMAASVHPATMPLVRQQLDMLATGQFRWTGEPWPGAKLDWTVQQEGDEWDRSGGGADAEDDYPWRTRLTLSLPSLGTVDVDLTLTGTRLMARVLASPGGAARLAGQSDTFRQRLAAAGIELSALSIREFGGREAMTPGGAAAAHAAASAYAARSADADAAAMGAAAASTHAHSAGNGSAGSGHANPNHTNTAHGPAGSKSRGPGRVDRSNTPLTDDYDWDI